MEILDRGIGHIEQLLSLGRVLHVDALVVQLLSNIVKLRDPTGIITRSVDPLACGDLFIELRNETAHGLRGQLQGLHSAVPGCANHLSDRCHEFIEQIIRRGDYPSRCLIGRLILDQADGFFIQIDLTVGIL